MTGGSEVESDPGLYIMSLGQSKVKCYRIELKVKIKNQGKNQKKFENYF